MTQYPFLDELFLQGNEKIQSAWLWQVNIQGNRQAEQSIGKEAQTLSLTLSVNFTFFHLSFLLK